jgi:GLPGLI family protein
MRNLIICAFLITFFSLFGQNSIEVKYHITANSTYETTAVLTINNHLSQYIVLKSINSPNEPTILSEDSNSINIIAPEPDIRPAIYINLNTKKLVSTVLMFQKNNLLKEDLPKIDWQIIDDFKTFNTLNCQKAIGYFRGRTYTVWFSSDIPLPFGPWKLNGLPGLILEAKDDKNQFYFSVYKIDFKTDATIENYPNIEEAITLKSFITTIMPAKIKELESLIRSQTDRHTTISSLSWPSRNSQKEIIYEWEEN